jgi:hypothetical protein
LSAIARYSVHFPAGSQGLLVIANGPRRARATARLVAELQAREPGRVHVASVQTPPTGYAGRFLKSIDVRGVLEETGRRSMAPLCKELDTLGITYKAHVEVGPWLAGIKRLARELGCSRVVAGSAFDALLLRSTLRDRSAPPWIGTQAPARTQR